VRFTCLASSGRVRHLVVLGDDQSKPGKIGLPWSLEAALKNRGAIFDDGDAAWVSHVVIDRNLITAQNPGSTDAAAYAVLKRLTE
jgi:putative intracellular protease/amidase